jgi:hypothetical protein
MSMKRLISCLVFVVACGGGGGSNDNPGGDGNPGSEPSTGGEPVPQMITLSGTATARGIGGATPVNGATVAAYRNSDENTPIGMATTGADGTFSITITTTGGAPLEGFLKATANGHVVSYLYPPGPVGSDLAMIPMNMLETGTYGTLYTLAGVGEMQGRSIVAMIVVGGTMLSSPPVQGATIAVNPAATYRYTNPQTGFPSATTSTHTDGIGFALNAMPGAITASAMKAGSTFKPTSLKAHAGALVQTLVTQ